MKHIRIFLSSLLIIGATSGIALAPLPAKAAGEYSAKWVAQSPYPPALKVGQKAELWVDFQNTGTSAWINSGNMPLRLGTSRSLDRESIFDDGSWMSSNRAATLVQNSVAPGETGRFVFSITAPNETGQYREYFRPVVENVTWLEDFGVYWDINVTEPSYLFEVSEISKPTEVVGGTEVDVALKLRNIGTETWTNNGDNPVRIGTAAPFDRNSSFYHSSWLSQNRVTTMEETSVAPGETGTFKFKMTAPNKNGARSEYFALVVENRSWMKENFVLLLNVTPARYAAELVSQAPDPSVLKPGETVELWAEFKNTGNVPWLNNGDTATRLGTAGPLDRISLFQDTGWLSGNRITSAPTKVQPGETARFAFTVTAPNDLGEYTEKFGLVAEGLSWLTDVNLKWNFVVEEEYIPENPIRVGLTYIDDPITISGNGAFTIRDGNLKAIGRINAGENVSINPISGGYQISSSSLGTQNIYNWLKIIPVMDTVLRVENPRISSRYNDFRGIIKVQRSDLSGRVWLVNELGMEEYLWGLAEVPDTWPMEAIKAQVVAARSFALTGKQGPIADIFDVYDDTRSQVYYGYDYETARPKIKEATQATSGQVITYGGEIVRAYYHSDSGGYLAAVQDVWSQSNPALAKPYLIAKTDPYARATAWSYSLSGDELIQKFSDLSGHGVINNIELQTFAGSERVERLIFHFDTGAAVSLPHYTFRTQMPGSQLKSMVFTVSNFVGGSNPIFQFNGKGNGHHVGLSQWSAYNMANQGFAYDQILNFFFDNTSVINYA